jgi:Flp pilus assembly protein TadG
MAMSTVLNYFRHHIRQFGSAQGGNVMLTFALLTVPIMGFVGSAVDYSRANSAKASMQAAADATALMLSKEVSGLTTGQIDSKASAYFTALLHNTDLTNVKITPTYSTSGGTQVVITGTGTVTTTFMKVVGISNLNVDVSSTVKWGNSRLRVALVLDNTGSMSSANKMNALKTATKNLLDQLQTAAGQNGDVYVSIIPFVKDVNVDKVNYNETWIDWTDWEAEPPILVGTSKKPSNWDSIGPGSTCPFTDSTHGFHCMDRPATLTGASTSTKIKSSGTYKSLICPSIDNGNKTPLKASVYYNGCYDSTTTWKASNATCPSGDSAKCTCTGSGSSKTCTTKSGYFYHPWRPAVSAYPSANVNGTPAHNTWNGCVVDRGDSTGPNSGNYDTNVVAPNTSNAATLFAAEQYELCPAVAVMPLSYNWTAMKSLVDKMSPDGNTNQAVGLVHGWMSLVGGGPFPTPPAMDSNYSYQQIIILLTDGLNTQDRWYTSASQIDARQKLTCDNVNAAGISLYTIQVNTDGDPTSSLLQNCAGKKNKYPDPDKFFLLTSANQLVTTFNQIGTALSNLRVAR